MTEATDRDGGDQLLGTDPLPERFSSARLRKALLLVALIVAAVAALVVLVLGLTSLRVRVVRGRPPNRVLAADELAHEHGDRTEGRRLKAGTLDIASSGSGTAAEVQE